MLIAKPLIKIHIIQSEYSVLVSTSVVPLNQGGKIRGSCI